VSTTQQQLSAIGSLFSHWCAVRPGLSVRFHFQEGHLRTEWLPRLPTKREIGTSKIRARYWQARHAFLTEIAGRTGLAIVVVDVAP
jgi:hypothetical protein